MHKWLIGKTLSPKTQDKSVLRKSTRLFRKPQDCTSRSEVLVNTDPLCHGSAFLVKVPCKNSCSLRSEESNQNYSRLSSVWLHGTRNLQLVFSFLSHTKLNKGSRFFPRQMICTMLGIFLADGWKSLLSTCSVKVSNSPNINVESIFLEG